MHVAPHHSPQEIRRELKLERDPRRLLRLQAVHLALQGHVRESIAQTLSVSVRSIDYWLSRYNHGGLPGLNERPRSGRPPRLQPEQLAAFEKRLQAGPVPEDIVSSFRGLDLQRILREEFGVELGLSQVYNLLHQLGYSSLMPRPQHRKADAAAQEAFKKTSGRR